MRHGCCALLTIVGGFSEVRAHAVARQLDSGLDGICLACLSFVSIGLDRGGMELMPVMLKSWHHAHNNHAG